MADGKAKHPTGETMPRVRYTVTPGIDTQIVFNMLPGGTCTLRQEGGNDSKHSLKLYADQEGTIRFYVHPIRASEVSAKFVIECEACGKVTEYQLELQASSKPIRNMPAPPGRKW